MSDDRRTETTIAALDDVDADPKMRAEREAAWNNSDMSDNQTTDILTADDHARGCAGREYACTCGYDERVADEIRRLRARVEPNLWKETVRTIFDELHFGADSVFKGQTRLARKIIDLIEERHRDYFCEGRTMAEWHKAKDDAS